MGGQDGRSVADILGKLTRSEYTLEDAAEWVARLLNTDDYYYTKRVVREALRDAVRTGELPDRVVDGQPSVTATDLKQFCQKRGLPLDKPVPEPQEQNDFSEHKITSLCMVLVGLHDLLSELTPELPEQKYKNLIKKLRAEKMPTTKMLEILADRTKGGDYEVLDNSTFRDVMTLARDRVTFSEKK